MVWRTRASVAAMVGLLASPAPAAPQAPAAAAPSVEKLGPGLLRVGPIRVDLTRREISLPATINDVLVLEFVANVAKGLKAYESAMTLQVDAITFNTALLADRLRQGQRAGAHPALRLPPGRPAIPVEMWIEWKSGAGTRRVPVEELLYDRQVGKTVPPGQWVYTGLTFLPDGRFWAEADGILIGFAHSPAPVIESIGGIGVNRYGAVVLQPQHRAVARARRHADGQSARPGEATASPGHGLTHRKEKGRALRRTRGQGEARKLEVASGPRAGGESRSRRGRGRAGSAKAVREPPGRFRAG